MSRLIDADNLHNAKFLDTSGFGEDVAYRVGRNDAIDAICENEPTIDAVEVVRCKDCKDIFFDDWYKCFSCANLYGLNEEVKPDDFCSHGERKESE